MNRYNRSIRWMLRIGIFIAGTIILFLAISPWLIDTGAVRQRIINEISQQTGIPLTFQEVRLSFLPRPQVTLAKGEVSIPGRVTASWRSLTAYPRLLPLLVRDIQIGRLSIRQPVVDISLPAGAAQTGDGRARRIAGIIQEAMAPIAGSISAIGSDLDAVIANGQLSITLQDKTKIRVTGIEAQIDSSAANLDIEVQSKAEWCDRIAIKAGINPQTMKCRGEINLVRLRPHHLPARWIPAGDIRVGASPVDVGLTFDTDGLRGVEARLQGTLPVLTVHRGANRFTFDGQAVAARFHQDDQGTTIALTELSLNQPQATLIGTFFRDRNSGRMKVDVTGRDVDIASIRQAALTLAGDIAGVNDTFDIVKGGQIPTIHLATQGQSIDSLGTLENLTGTANLLQGEIFVPGVELAATDVSADVTLAKGMLAADNLTARYGNNRVTDGAMRLGLSGDNPLFHLDMGMTADLSEGAPILKRVLSDNRFLREMDRIGDISGHARGRLVLGERLEAIDAAVTVSDFNLSARASEAPYLLELEGGNFAYSGASVSVEHLNGSIRAAAISANDTVVIGEKGVQWLAKTLHLPSIFLFRPPLRVANGRFRRDQAGRVAFSGEFTIQEDLNLSADMLLTPDRINIRKLVVKDKFSQATIGLAHRENNIVLDFDGNLEKSTMDKLLADNQAVLGSIKGDLHLKVVNDHPLESEFEGEASASDLVLFRHLDLPVTVKHISVKGIKDSFHLESDMIVQQDHQLTLKGDLNYSPTGIRVDADLVSNGIELDNLVTALGESRKNDDGVQKKRFWDFPAGGVVRLDAEFVKYGRYVWRPLVATITLNPDKITVASTETVLCGVSTPGTVTLTPDEVSLYVTPMAHHQDINTSVTCLWDNSAKVSGNFDLSGEIRGRGRPEDLLASLSGNIEISSTGGTIYAGRTYRNIRDIFKLINITEIYRGRLLELSQDGFAYNTMKTKVRIKNNAIVFEEGIIDAPELNAAYSGVFTFTDKNLDITALVAPLKTVDTIVKNSPIVGYVAGGNLATIPISMKGDPNHPDIGILPPAAVGEGLVGILKRTLKLPVKIVDPFMPEK